MTEDIYKQVEQDVVAESWQIMHQASIDKRQYILQSINLTNIDASELGGILFDADTTFENKEGVVLKLYFYSGYYDIDNNVYESPISHEINIT